MPRLPRADVERMMDASPEGTLENALGVFEVFASGSLTDEVYILEDVAGKRIAIAPAALKDKYRRGGPWPSSRSLTRWERGEPKSAWAPRSPPATPTSARGWSPRPGGAA